MDSEVHVQSSVHITQLAITAGSDDTDAPGLSAAHNVPKVARKYRASPLSGCVRPRSAHVDQGGAYGDPSNHGAPLRASTRAIRDPTTPPLGCTSANSLEIAGKSRICQSRETPSDSGSTPVANTLYAGQLSSGLHNTSVPSVNVNESVSMSNNRISTFIKAMTESDVRTLYSIPGMAHMARSVQHALDVDATKKSAVDMLAPAILAERNLSPGTAWIAEHNRRIQKIAQAELDRIYHEEERRLREAFLARFGLESFSQFDQDIHVSGPEDSDADSASVYSTESVNDSAAVLYHMRAPPMNDELSKGNS
ncbi:hypothetical protein WOLCODRAFT_139364 [Wolfiporia cocos MD-104 SS10]|uniref:Uncharacterized protein n=1 Tax=Wolfiporia cocos (strain MD-104) TaxID=742152 RepID=A0A2H3K7F7_WOLCO|nr:hypothetical protein WOLCODRAFT_139364 [Wolfiporia cocos MD-104 SS10]